MRPLCPEYSETFSYSRFPSREKIDLFRGLSYPFCSKNLDDSKRGGGGIDVGRIRSTAERREEENESNRGQPVLAKIDKVLTDI